MAHLQFLSSIQTETEMATNIKDEALVSRPGAAKTGYGESIQLAIDDAISHLPADNVRIRDGFVTYTVLALGRFRGGIAGVDKHFARVEMKFSADQPS
jgi:hypothetical protein